MVRRVQESYRIFCSTSHRAKFQDGVEELPNLKRNDSVPNRQTPSSRAHKKTHQSTDGDQQNFCEGDLDNSSKEKFATDMSTS